MAHASLTHTHFVVLGGWDFFWNKPIVPETTPQVQRAPLRRTRDLTCFIMPEALEKKFEAAVDVSDGSGASGAPLNMTRVTAAFREHAAVRVRETGIAGWPRQIIHSDFHPGNVIFADKGVRAVVDFDSARVGPRAIDVANGALQFSVTRRLPSPTLGHG